MILLRNCGSGWGMLAVSFTLYYAISSLLVSRLGVSASVQLLVVVSLKSFYIHVNYCTDDYFWWCGIIFWVHLLGWQLLR